MPQKLYVLLHYHRHIVLLGLQYQQNIIPINCGQSCGFIRINHLQLLYTYVSIYEFFFKGTSFYKLLHFG